MTAMRPPFKSLLTSSPLPECMTNELKHWKASNEIAECWLLHWRMTLDMMLASQVIILFAVSCSHARLCSTQSTSFLALVVPSSKVHYNLFNISYSSMNLLEVVGSPSTTIYPMMVMHISAEALVRTSYCSTANFSMRSLQITLWMS